MPLSCYNAFVSLSHVYVRVCLDEGGICMYPELLKHNNDTYS